MSADAKRTIVDLAWEELLSLQQQVVTEISARVAKSEARLAEGDDADMWPHELFDACLEVFGPAMYARGGRTFTQINRRVSHALKVWGDKYGPLNPEQHAWAVNVLVGAVKGAVARAQDTGAAIYPVAFDRLDRAVHHEAVHSGFVERRGEQRQLDGMGEMLPVAS